MKRPNKQTCIDLIVEEIDKGKRYTDVWESLGNLWEISNPTFNKYWKSANEIHTERREAINEATLNEAINHETERVKRDLLQRDEALEILTEIARNQIMNDKGYTNDSDRIIAIKQVAKMEGWEAPDKKDITFGSVPLVPKINIVYPKDTDE